jgi:3-hydroxybutyryl-CoA dehydratase
MEKRYLGRGHPAKSPPPSPETDKRTLQMIMAPRPVPVSDFFVGQTCAYHQVIDDALVRGYADLTGDHNKIHVDDAFARKTKFGRRIAHGGIMFGMISKVLGGEMPGLGTVYLSQLVNFHAPVFIDDTVTLVATITALLPKHVAKINTIITKQTGEIVVDGVSTVKLPGWLMKA